MLQSRSRPGEKAEEEEEGKEEGCEGKRKRERERGRTHSPWLLFLDRFLRRSLRSVANPNSKSFSLIFGFGRFIVSPLKIRSTGSVVHNNGKSVSVLIRR